MKTMKNVILIVVVTLMSITTFAQKDTISYDNGWVYERSVENTIGVYLAVDSTGVRKVVLSVLEDSIKFNHKTYYVEASQDRGKDFPIQFKDCYLFIISDNDDNRFYMYLDKVKYPGTVNKYHFVLKKDERELPLITEIITKSVSINTVDVDPITKREDREKLAWFNKMYKK